MVNLSMILSVADCFSIGTAARHIVGLVAEVGLPGITGQLTRLSVTISDAMMIGLIMRAG